MSTILAIDPGTVESGWATLSDGRVFGAGVCPNETLLELIDGSPATALAIEMIASYGMPVGEEVFQTCVWVGRFIERWKRHFRAEPQLIYRKDVKLHLCGSPKAKDPHIRQRLLDLIGPQGTKRDPGPCYGIKSHAWAALAVAVTAQAA